ncbi:hypothetical protein EJB05_37360, partial [Eragrostis curvula]
MDTSEISPSETREKSLIAWIKVERDPRESKAAHMTSNIGARPLERVLVIHKYSEVFPIDHQKFKSVPKIDLRIQAPQTEGLKMRRIHDSLLSLSEDLEPNRMRATTSRTVLHPLQAFYAYVHDDHTVRINPLICYPFAADFESDCIHISNTQSVAAKAEALELFSVRNQLTSSHSGK